MYLFQSFLHVCGSWRHYILKSFKTIPYFCSKNISEKRVEEEWRLICYKTAPAVLIPLCPVQTCLDRRGHKWSSHDPSACVFDTERTNPNPNPSLSTPQWVWRMLLFCPISRTWFSMCSSLSQASRPQGTHQGPSLDHSRWEGSIHGCAPVDPAPPKWLAVLLAAKGSLGRAHYPPTSKAEFGEVILLIFLPCLPLPCYRPLRWTWSLPATSLTESMLKEVVKLLH